MTLGFLLAFLVAATAVWAALLEYQDLSSTRLLYVFARNRDPCLLKTNEDKISAIQELHDMNAAATVWRIDFAVAFLIALCTVLFGSVCCSLPALLAFVFFLTVTGIRCQRAFEESHLRNHCSAAAKTLTRSLLGGSNVQHSPSSSDSYSLGIEEEHRRFSTRGGVSSQS